jgi:uncharacterized SAM-binding protein YcdF (DUF218 family)
MSSDQRGGIIFKLLVLLILVALGMLFYLLRHPLLRAAGEFWVVDELPEAADAVVVLGDDNFSGDRATRAAELYHRGLAPRVVASGRQLRRNAGLAELIGHDLIERGVPAALVIRFPHTAENTREEAQALRRVVLERGWRRVLVVTSNYHTRRTRYIFGRIFPPEVQVRVVAARDVGYDPRNWWESRLGTKLFFFELVAYPVAMWELRHAEPAAHPASANVPVPARP